MVDDSDPGPSDHGPSDHGLAGAYALTSPDDNRRHYDDWAETYDTGFGAATGYVVPTHIAALYREASRDAAPVLDVGAGTGLLGRALGGLTVDGIDISPAMLARAEAKGVYRDLIEADLTAALPLPDAAYAGVISAGTFTHGHVGPDAFEELLRVARPGATFACGMIESIVDSGFGSYLARLVAHGRITPVAWREGATYEGVDHPHADDRTLVAMFEKA